VQSGDAGQGKEITIWDSSELRVPFWARVAEVRHPCPRGTDIASRLLRKPENSYMQLILSGKKCDYRTGGQKSTFHCLKKRV